MDYEISTFWSLIVVFGFFGWIGSTVALIFRGIDDNNRLVKRKALFWGIMIVVCYALWVTGLMNA
mgnify:CR=1 FL=1